MANQPRRVRTLPRTPVSYGRPQPVRSRRKSQRFGLGVRIPKRLIILIIFVLLVGFGIKSLFTIHHVVVTTTSAPPQVLSTLEQLTSHGKQGSMLTLNTDLLTADLETSVPAVKSVRIDRRWPSGLSVSITLNEPALGWSTGNQSYQLDRDGTVMGLLPAGSKLPLVIDDNNLPVTTDQRVVSPRFIVFAQQAASALAVDMLGPTKLEVRDTTSDLYATTTKGYTVIFDTTRTPADEFADLKTILTSLASQHVTPTQYIDVRVLGKAYYR